MPRPTCPHCGRTLTAAEFKTIDRSANLSRRRKWGSAGGKASSATVDTVERARKAVNARWQKHRETRAKKEARN